MEDNTTFRKLLADQLTLLVNAPELDSHFLQVDDCVEDKLDILSEFVDYYTEDLLKYEPFIKEFSKVEIEELRNFIHRLNNAFAANARWEDIHFHAIKLLRILQPPRW